MRIFKRLLTTVSILIVLVVAVGALLPDRAHVERSTVISVSPAVVFALINDFREFNKWSPWFARDPGVQIFYEGPQAGTGAAMRW